MRALWLGLATLGLGCSILHPWGRHTVRENYPGGQPFRVQHYNRQGQEQGLQTFWRPDGTLHSNYEVRNGRRYGLVNAKPCMPFQGPSR